MSVDLAVLTPAYLDYTFVGLEALPAPGEERFAGDMLRSPGGGAITAVAAARLGLSVALLAPIGDDLPGRFVRRELEAEGVEVAPPRGTRTPTTVVMPVGGERSMVTVDPGVRARVADVAPLAPRAVAATLEQVDLLPAGIPAYVTCGEDDARAYAGRLPRVPARPGALVVSPREAKTLTGSSDLGEAAKQLTAVSENAIVTMCPDGAVAVVDGHAVTLGGFDAPTVDTTGTGDLLAAAFAWAHLAGAPADVALQWANLYAGLSVSSHTAVGGALDRARLLEEGARRGLPELPRPAAAAP